MIKLLKDDASLELHFNSVKGFIQNRVKTILKDGHILKGKKGQKKKKISVSPFLTNELKKLLNDRYLKILIFLEPAKFEEFSNELRSYNRDLFNKSSNTYKIIYNIFVSNVYEQNFDKLKFINSIGIDTCPYCNRNYIYSLDEKDEIKPQIDHFFPKTKYPFLAMSFYNLIPSCQTCNGFGAKHDNDPCIVGLVNPYLLNASDFTFGYKLNSIRKINPLIDKTNLDKSNLSITLSTKLNGHKRVFKLDKLYEKHVDHVLELILRSKLEYTEDFRNYLKGHKDYKFSDYEIDRMIINNYSQESEIHKRPLAKLYQDISKDLGLI